MICIEDEQGEGEWGNFNGLESKEIRRVFIRKVLVQSIEYLESNLLDDYLLGLFYFNASIIGDIWYHCVVSFHVKIFFSS